MPNIKSAIKRVRINEEKSHKILLLNQQCAQLLKNSKLLLIKMKRLQMTFSKVQSNT